MTTSVAGKASTEIRHRTPDSIRGLIVANSAHHGKNLVKLVQKVGPSFSESQFAIICSSADADVFAFLSPEFRVFVVDRNGSVTEIGPTGLDSPTKKAARSDKGLAVALRESFAPLLGPRLRQTSVGFKMREMSAYLGLKSQRAGVQQIFESFCPNVVIALGDRHPDFEAAVLVEARARACPIVLPYVTYSGRDILLEVRRDDPSYAANLSAAYVAKTKEAYPSCVFQDVFYQPAPVLRALNKFGALSENPWCIGNGKSDVVCVDNRRTAARYEREGVAPAKLRVVGDVSYDEVFQVAQSRNAVRDAILTKYDLDRQKKLIVVALPQLAEQGVLDWESHWRETEFLVRTLCSTEQNIVLSLHPRMKRSDYQFLTKRFRCVISEDPLSQIISSPDLFIANYSSTVIWAVLCGVPALIVDFYGLNYSFFDYLKSVRVTRDAEEFPQVLAAALINPNTDFAPDWHQLSRDEVFDGKTVTRYTNLLRSMACVSSD